ncbi:universal stress protein [Pikeienuella piscinae]|uniref:Universal stress protein n=1 Tax=Pikeienuella piscinae TaxID=2748098 RepID=A0A7L5BV36_9RHOB|nr:universal stress protein [Pikeienuella piscinae]QIE55572.1 universal stress protein [Pikeienuella piscinae]
MFETVLLPVDLGHEESWRKALPLADELRGKTGALHILAVLPDFGESIVSSFFPSDFKENALNEVDAALRAFIEGKNLDRTTPHVGYGHVAEAILGAAGRVGADLIVMASHPPDELRSILIGSQAGKVVRHAAIPVLVAR